MIEDIAFKLKKFKVALFVIVGILFLTSAVVLSYQLGVERTSPLEVSQEAPTDASDNPNQITGFVTAQDAWRDNRGGNFGFEYVTVQNPSAAELLLLVGYQSSLGREIVATATISIVDTGEIIHSDLVKIGGESTEGAFAIEADLLQYIRADELEVKVIVDARPSEAESAIISRTFMMKKEATGSEVIALLKPKTVEVIKEVVPECDCDDVIELPTEQASPRSNVLLWVGTGLLFLILVGGLIFQTIRFKQQFSIKEFVHNEHFDHPKREEHHVKAKVFDEKIEKIRSKLR